MHASSDWPLGLAHFTCIGVAPVDLEWMAWRQVASLPDAVRVVETAGRPGLIRHAQLCDAPAERPGSTEAVIQEARAGHLASGEGALPLRALVAALPAAATLSAEEHVRAKLAAADG